MKKFFSTILVLAVAVFVNAQQLSKVYVLSEGGFSAGTSMLSLYDNINNTFTQSIFSTGNIGLYPDGLVYYEGYLYLTEQGSFGSSGKIYKLDTLGTVLASATVGTNPYSLAIINNKIYITNGPASNVSVLNLNDLSFVKNISVGVYPQEIITFSNKVFVANNSVWGGALDSTVSVIDPTLDSVVATITVKKDPSAFAITNDNYLLIGCPGDENNGRIYKIDPTTYQKIVEYSVPIYGFGKDISLDKNGNDLYFISYLNDIVKYNPNTNTSSLVLSSVYPNNYYYGYSFEPVSKKHFVLDAKNFTVNGSLSILDSSYNLISSYTTSIAPRRIEFKYNENPSNVDDKLVASSFSLQQNYPNPFNPSTNISWQMPESAHITIKVYNILGNEILTLVDEYKQAGNYNINFNAGDLSSGTYFYVLKVNDGNQTFSTTKKMTLLK
ncbi:5'-Nucleotidase domain protein [Ignavibacterium album JCM 16511]|uniref:5'-Nucleotidase domain protein n=1 Tax=Ignavibacterium album (strain DSM 19864 / JCM 16511 / NBRC 101810 / Mat9-16) TaxID=945713 RepID=I0ALZ7_IGNAJ|nr:T9SS type A sorting domain-containing protein [Ignavibacterium album]AFH50004.1 5'-Nucleotidase domain protein [Ignavibacterium album JCM 16511]